MGFRCKMAELRINKYGHVFRRNFYSQIVTRDVWLYFMWCLAYGWSQLFGLTFNIKRRDFYIMVIHHVAFVTLLTLTGTYDAFRVITITIFVCDSTDVLLEVLH